MIELHARGSKVILRTLEREHCRELWNLYEPAEPLPTEPIRPGLSIEGADKWFEEMQAKQGQEHVYLGIFSEDRLVGDIQLSSIDWRNRTASLGCGIARQKDRGKGYGTDAARTLIRYGFGHLNLYRISAATVEYNVAAQRSLEKCGFVLEGRERQAIYCDSRRWDRLHYGLLRSEFKGSDE